MKSILKVKVHEILETLGFSDHFWNMRNRISVGRDVFVGEEIIGTTKANERSCSFGSND